MEDSKVKSPLLRPTTYADAQVLVRAKATYYPRFTRIYIPVIPYKKLKDGMEANTSADQKAPLNSPSDETDLERSIRRTRKAVKDYVFCNNFELFASLTFKEDRQNIERCKSKMSNWIKNQKKRTGKFEYLIVPELHKDSKSLHFHGLFKGYIGKLKQSISSRTSKALNQNGHSVYEFLSYTHGFTNVKQIDKSQDSHTKIGFYIQKYITKDMPLFFGKNRYWVSNGLNTPNTEVNPEEWYMHIKPDREYKNEHGKILEFDSNKHAFIDLFVEGKS